MEIFRFLLLIPVLMLLGTKCNKDEECHKTITFTNNDTVDLYVLGSWEYPDTLSYLTIAFDKYYKINSKSTDDVVLRLRDCYEARFRVSDTLMIYVFNADSVDANNEKVLKRYDLSLQDLENTNWTIKYP